MNLALQKISDQPVALQESTPKLDLPLKLRITRRREREREREIIVRMVVQTMQVVAGSGLSTTRTLVSDPSGNSDFNHQQYT